MLARENDTHGAESPHGNSIRRPESGKRLDELSDGPLAIGLREDLAHSFHSRSLGQMIGQRIQ
ncbi:MAG: hypothetical protein ACREBZ_00250 [Thermoplasmata archaeon]